MRINAIIHTGQPVGQSGVYEWFYYEPQLDRVIAPLLFSLAGDDKRDTLEELVKPKKLYTNQTLYQELEKLGFSSHVFGAGYVFVCARCSTGGSAGIFNVSAGWKG